MKKYFLLLFAFVGTLNTNAQVILTILGSPYTQNFNSLGTGTVSWSNNSTLPNWYAASKKKTIKTMSADNGNTWKVGFYNYGETAGADRALGSLSHSSQGDYAYGVRMKNNTGSPIRAFEVTYTGEQWRNNKAMAQDLSFSYQISNSSITSVSSSSGIWTSVDPLKFTSINNGGKAKSLNGNNAANQKKITYIITGINIPTGSEIMFRWLDMNHSKKDHAIAIDDVSITPVYVTEYYLKSNADASILASWGSSTNGSGIKPLSFTADKQVFYVKNATTITLLWNFTISGNGSKLVIGDGVNATNFIIPANKWVNATMEVQNKSTLTINNTNIPVLGVLSIGSTVEFGASATQYIPGNIYSNLTIQGTALKYLNNNAQVSGILTMAGGNLDLGDFDLKLPAGSTLTGADSSRYFATSGEGHLVRFVAGNKTDVFFPVGKTNQYCPVILKQANNGDDDNFSVRLMENLYDSYDSTYEPKGGIVSTEAVNSTWIINEEEGGSNATITLEWRRQSELPNLNRNKLSIIHFDDANGWEKKTTTSANGNGPFTSAVSGISDFSPFGVSGDFVPLPVEFISFTCSWDNNYPLLKWETACELNNSHFEIQRSADAENWQILGNETGNSTTNFNKKYKFIDYSNPAYSAVHYYRLRQVDFNGNFEYSKIIALRTVKKTCLRLTTYSNLAENALYLKADCAEKTTYTIMLLNSLGNLVYFSEANLEDPHKIATGALQAGIYYVKVTDAQNSLSKPVVILH